MSDWMIESTLAVSVVMLIGLASKNGMIGLIG